MNNSNGKCTDCQFLDTTPTVSDLQLGQPFPQVQLISGLGSTNTPIGLPRPEQVANIDNGSELCNVCEMPFCANHIVGSSGRCIYCVIDGLREIDREYVKSLLFAFGKHHYQIWPRDHLRVRELILQSQWRRGPTPDWRRERLKLINSRIFTENKIPSLGPRGLRLTKPQGLSAYGTYNEGLEIAKAVEYVPELVQNDSEFNHMCEYFELGRPGSVPDGIVMPGRLKSALKTGANKWERALLYDIKTDHSGRSSGVRMTWYRIYILAQFCGQVPYDDQKYAILERDPDRHVAWNIADDPTGSVV